MAGTTERAGVALLIGIGHYLHPEQVWPLRFAARDAEAMVDALVDPDVCGFPSRGVKLLADESATRDAVAHHLSKWLPEQARGAEIAVIYFAGHGMIHRIGHRDEGYLLPYDADPEDLVTRGVLMTDLARWIEAITADAVVVCLDCCHAAKVIPRGRPPAESAARDMRIKPAIFQELTGRGRYLIASCDDGQVSVEAESWGHGLFTYHLLEGIRGAGDRDGDGLIGITELFEYVAEAVDRDARALGMMQKPWSCAIGPGGVYLSSVPEKQVDAGQEPTQLSAIRAVREVWRKRGPVVAVRELERVIVWSDVSQLTSVVELLGTMKDAAGIPLLFRCLAHQAEAVRDHAKNAVQAFGWAKVSAIIEDLAQRGEPDQVSGVLDGLAAFEAHADTVALLDRLVALLKADLRNRTILLLERKRQSLELERVAALFRESGSLYQIQKPLGQGLFTAAYLARDESMELDVVVRVLRDEYTRWPEIRAQFLDLGRRSVKLVHHNLVTTREVRPFPERNVYYAVRDFVEGATLQKLLESGRVFDADQIAMVLRQILLALTPVHAAGMAHGSIKPSNIFVCAQDRVVLGDLAMPMQGISLHLDRLSYDYRYAPPEMFRQGGVLGPWSDFYSLGCVAYELACGKPPFVSDNYFELAGQHDRGGMETPSRGGSRLGRSGDQFILRLLSKSPSDRFPNLDAAIAALDDLRARSRPSAEPLAPPAQLLGDQSLLTYAGNPMVSVVLFTSQIRAAGSQMPSAEETWPAGPGSSAEQEDSSPVRIGRYVVIRLIGAGGMGRVYLARDEVIGREVAIKVLPRAFGSGTVPNAVFRREASIMAKLNHPSFAAIHDVGEHDRCSYLVVEFVKGQSLRERLNVRPMLPDEAARLVVTLARAMHHAHMAGVVHRDLKPNNILITEEGVPKILDLGLAMLLDGQMQRDVTTTAGSVVGTPMYMAPEQVRGEMEAIGPGADVYALGAILYEMMAGRLPFERRSSVMGLMRQVLEEKPQPPSRWRPELPPDLGAICLKCLEKEPKQRYATAVALAEDLERFLAGQSVLAAPLTVWDRVRRVLSFNKSPKRTDYPRK
jgi:serine/threonine protein kinase